MQGICQKKNLHWDEPSGRAYEAENREHSSRATSVSNSTRHKPHERDAAFSAVKTIKTNKSRTSMGHKEARSKCYRFSDRKGMLRVFQTSGKSQNWQQRRNEA